MMDRAREVRRVNTMAAGNGALKKRYRSGSNSLRDSTDEDAQGELQDTGFGRLRERVAGKKDRDGYRERDRERERERSRDRRGEKGRDRGMMLMMSNSRNKRRRAERDLAHQHHHQGSGLHFEEDDSSEESVNEEDEEEEEEDCSAMLPPRNTTTHSSSSPSFTTPTSLHHHSFPHRKSFSSQPSTPNSPLPNNKGFRSSPTTVSVSTAPPAFALPPWASDEISGVSVPRKARSASTKRPHDAHASNNGGSALATDQIHRHASGSPSRSGVAVSASASAAQLPVSSSSSIASMKKKMRPNGPTQRPPKSTSKTSSSAHDEIEIEIAEVLYGLMRQPQGPLPPKAEPKDSKPKVSSPPITVSAPKRKRPRPVRHEDEHHSTVFPIRSSHASSTAKVGEDSPVKVETHSSPPPEKVPGSVFGPAEAARNSSGTESVPDPLTRNSDTKKEEPPLKVTKADSTSAEPETQRGDKLEIDLMVLPPARSSPDRDEDHDLVAVDPKRTIPELETTTKQNVLKDKTIDLQLDLDKTEKQDNPTTNQKCDKSVPVPMSFTGWPGGIPPVGYMSSSAALQPLIFNQQRPKRCATHFSIARNIYNCQQFSKMNQFWPTPSNLPVLSSKDKHSISETSQREQLLVRHPLPPNGLNNVKHSPAFHFSLTPQQPSVRPSSTAPAAAASAAMNYNLSSGDAQYLAILQNGAYPIPVPSPVRGPHPQPIPFFNGSFYSSQILHPHTQPTLRPHHLPIASPSQKHGGDVGSEDSPSSANAYGQNFVVPNFAFMNPESMAGNCGDKKQQSSKLGADSLPSQAFAMSFASSAQNPEAARHGFQFMQTVDAQKKSGGNDEDDRKFIVGSSIAFSRSDMADSSVRTHNRASTSGRTSSTVVPSSQQIIHQKQQFNVSIPPGRGKSTSNGNLYPDHVSQWRNSLKNNMPQIHSPSQQQIQSQHQISFGPNSKSTPTQGQSNQSSNLSPTPMMATSPKSGGGSPITTSNSSASKVGHNSTPPSQQQTKKSAVSLTLGPMPTSVPSKSQLPKVVLPPSQMMYPSFVQQPPPSTSGFYLQRPQAPPSKGGGIKGGPMSYSQFPVPPPAGKQHQLVTPAFPYALPAAVQIKQAQQKRPGD